MSSFDHLISRIRQSLNSGAPREPAAPNGAHPQPIAQPDLGGDELRAQFVAALTAVGGAAIEAAGESEAIEKIAALLRSRAARSAAIGEGITTDSASAAARLSHEGINVSVLDTCGPALFKEQLARVDAGIVEVDYAIAATGTLVMAANSARPRSLSLLPPINIAILRSDRILPNLAAVLSSIGPQNIAAHPVVMVTGPSRTADIEKRIVIGVHGPKELYVALIGDLRR